MRQKAFYSIKWKLLFKLLLNGTNDDRDNIRSSIS